MGWSFSHIYCSPKEELRRLVESDHYVKLDEKGNVIERHPSPYKLLDIALVALSEAYMAVLDTRDGKVRAWTFLIRMGSKKTHWNFGYKDMSEDMGPCMSRCPQRILDALSPVGECYQGSSLEHAAKWREANRQVLHRRKAAKTLQKGERIRLHTPVRFMDGTTRDTFTVLENYGRRRRFLSDDGAFCTIGSFDGLEFERLTA